MIQAIRPHSRAGFPDGRRLHAIDRRGLVDQFFLETLDFRGHRGVHHPMHPGLKRQFDLITAENVQFKLLAAR